MTTNNINNISSNFTTTNAFTSNLSFDSGTTTISNYQNIDFIPVLSFGGSSTGITYNLQEGTIINFGKFQYLNITVSLSSKGTATGVATISGYNSTPNNFLRFPIVTSDIIVGGMGPIVQILGTGIYELYYQESNAFITALDDTDFQNNSQVWINTCFQIA